MGSDLTVKHHQRDLEVDAEGQGSSLDVHAERTAWIPVQGEPMLHTFRCARRRPRWEYRREALDYVSAVRAHQHADAERLKRDLPGTPFRPTLTSLCSHRGT